MPTGRLATPHNDELLKYIHALDHKHRKQWAGVTVKLATTMLEGGYRYPVGIGSFYKVNSICLDFSSPSRPPSSLFVPCPFGLFVLVTTVIHLSSRSFHSLNRHCPSLAINLVDRDSASNTQPFYTPSKLEKQCTPSTFS